MSRSLGLALVLLAAVVATHAQDQRPTFRSVTDLLIVETQVVDGDGKPIVALGPEAFEVKVGNKLRSVVSADLVQYAAGSNAAVPRQRLEAAPVQGSLVPRAEDGRLYVIAVDEHSFSDHQLLPIVQEARRFVGKLQPQDTVGVFGFPTGRTSVNPTRDRSVVLAALGPALGVRTRPDSTYHFSPSEIIDISAGDAAVISRVYARECGPNDRACAGGIVQEAKFLGSYYEAQARQSMNGLRSLFKTLAAVPGRKTIVLLSGGLLSSDRIGGRPEISIVVKDAGRQAAEANATLYVIHADTHFDDTMSVRAGRGARAPDIRDTGQMAEGLDYLAGAANGHLINVRAGTAEYAFDRVIRETAAYYILGVAIEPRDRDGKTHFISVKVKEPRGLTVRHRASMVVK
ncbi:MAG TPA: VWA domain-containing protein [Vicinamibacterales bacterium]|nr:VWA domain-containing protein [Vicinamibacterales bacterium]